MSKRRNFKHRNRKLRRQLKQLDWDLTRDGHGQDILPNRSTMNKFKPGDLVRLEFVPESYVPYRTRQLQRFVGKVGYIQEEYLTGASVMYEVLFNNYSSWIPEEALSYIGSSGQVKDEFKILSYSTIDPWGERFSVTTQPNPDESLPGWVTEISHNAYAKGEKLIVSICVSAERADFMHRKWIRVLTLGPLPSVVEEVGLGSWKNGTVIHPRSSWYTAIPLGY